MKTNDKVYANLVQNLVRFGNKPRKPLSRKALLVQSLHGGEQQDVADGLAVGQQHDKAVEAEAEATRDGPFGSIRERNLLWHKGFRVSGRVFPLCWTLCFFGLGPRDTEGWERRSEVLKSLEMTGF